ncbi:MAG TPA: tRNA (adenosine(37)-N6)-threonylcarbamoyltransferase complex ATPase subunit type 1 TsaE [Thermoanaerobaculia bacterium]
MKGRWLSASEEETLALGRELAEELAPDGVLLLSGDLGSGKTVLTRGVAEGLGIDPREVQSPTFNLIREHRGSRGRLVHADLYRLDPDEVPALGLEELLAGPGVKVVEWAERLPFPVPGARALRLGRLPEGGREIVEIGT